MDNNDSVKVVRCKNCKFCEIYMRYGKPIDYSCTCEHWQDAEGWDKSVEPDDFCSYGEETDDNRTH